MRDIIDTVKAWSEENETLAIATVVNTWGSSPRKVGSSMVVTADGSMAGSVSGGCVEGAVVEKARQILAGGTPELLTFGVSDETAWEVGLACGGSIEVFVCQIDDGLLNEAAALIEQDKTIGILTRIEGDETQIGKQALLDATGDTVAGDPELIESIQAEEIKRVLSSGESARLETAQSPNRPFFLQVIPAPQKLVIVGGVHISVALAGIAKTLGYETIVVDPRRLFGSDQRFPAVDRLLRAWPQEAYQQIELDAETAVAVLTHDPKIDDPAIIGALRSPAYYIGVLGSRRTHSKRLERLAQAGIAEDQLARLHAPIGLHIGAQSPEEIALSIMAEIVASHNKLPAV